MAKSENTTADTNNVLSVRRRAVKAQAVQFTGKNGAEVVAFLKERLGKNESARNGGSYVSVVKSDNHNFRLRKGDWVVIDADGSIDGYSPDAFAKFFSIKG